MLHRSLICGEEIILIPSILAHQIMTPIKSVKLSTKMSTLIVQIFLKTGEYNAG